MSKPKFKVGDKVLVTNDKEKLNRIGCPSYYAGEKGEVAMYKSDTHYALVRFSNGDSWWVYSKFLKNIRPEKIIIYRNGSEVIAKNTATGKTGVARCNPADEFDFNTGVKLAFERLINPEPEKPKYYSGKVVCVSSYTSFYTKGKIYEIKDGVGKDDTGDTMTRRPVKSFEEFNRRMLSEFIELVE